MYILYSISNMYVLYSISNMYILYSKSNMWTKMVLWPQRPAP